MFGQYCSASQRPDMSTVGLTQVSFQDALTEYRDLVGGQRVRAICYLYIASSDVLIANIERHFSTKFEWMTCGNTARFVYLGIPMTVTVEDRGIFKLCEEF